MRLGGHYGHESLYIESFIFCKINQKSCPVLTQHQNTSLHRVRVSSNDNRTSSPSYLLAGVHPTLNVAEAIGDGAWMKQVAEVVCASQNCIDLYVQSLHTNTSSGEQGLLSNFRLMLRLV